MSEQISSFSGHAVISGLEYLLGPVKETTAGTIARRGTSKFYPYDVDGRPVKDSPINYSKRDNVKTIGVEHRHLAPDETTASLGVKAIQQLLASSQKDPVPPIFWNSSQVPNVQYQNAPDLYGAAISTSIAESLNANSENIDIDNTFCTGMLVSLMRAVQYSNLHIDHDSGVGPETIFGSSEHLSSHFPDREFPCKDEFMFSDGAVAGKLRAVDSDYNKDTVYRICTRHYLERDEDHDIYTAYRGHDEKPTIALPGGKNIIRKAADSMATILKGICNDASVDLENLDFVGFHPGSLGVSKKFFSDAVEAGVRSEALRMDDVVKPYLREYGNSGGATLGPHLKGVLSGEIPVDGPFAFVSVGAGYNVAGILFEKVQ